MKWPAAAGAFTLALSLAPAALAQANDKNAWDGDYRKSSVDRRRADLTLGLSVGLHLGDAHGFPNEADKIDNPLYETETGNALGPGGAAWLGVAMSDWLTLGLGGASIQLASGDIKASATSFLCRVETYPLYGVGGLWRDVGVAGNFGLGLLTLEDGGEEKADGGATSMVAGSLFYEAFRSAGLALGPMAEVTHMWSFSANLTSAWFGARLAFYSAGGRGEE
ncbi:MAG TPA: hypothetical protein VK524_24755 [Polyangiaceae bacterium]|nr:hypothetical protein [Polyangiaceae bacterium]